MAGGGMSLSRLLRGELLDYVRRQGLRTGPVFVTRNGKMMGRTQVTAETQSLSRDARVEEAKCNPRCLRKLYLATQAEVERGVRLLAEQSTSGCWTRSSWPPVGGGNRSFHP